MTGSLTRSNSRRLPSVILTYLSYNKERKLRTNGSDKAGFVIHVRVKVNFDAPDGYNRQRRCTMQTGDPLTEGDIKQLSIELTLDIIRQNLTKHGYDGARIPVDEFYRTLDDFLTEFHHVNARRKENGPTAD